MSNPGTCIPCKHYEKALEEWPCMSCKNHDQFEDKIPEITVSKLFMEQVLAALRDYEFLCCREKENMDYEGGVYGEEALAEQQQLIDNACVLKMQVSKLIVESEETNV